MYRHLLAHLFSHLSQISGSSAIRFAGVIVVATVLSGCGNKGALYVPEDAATSYQLQADRLQADPIQAHQNKD